MERTRTQRKCGGVRKTGEGPEKGFDPGNLHFIALAMFMLYLLASLAGTWERKRN